MKPEVLEISVHQALCDRTMKTIEMLQREHADKLRYFLSKADTVQLRNDS